MGIDLTQRLILATERFFFRLFNKLAIIKQPNLQYNSTEEQKPTLENSSNSE